MNNSNVPDTSLVKKMNSKEIADEVQALLSEISSEEVSDNVDRAFYQMGDHDGLEAMRAIYSGEIKPTHKWLVGYPSELGDVIVELISIPDHSEHIKNFDGRFLPMSTIELLELIDFYAGRLMELGDDEEAQKEFDSLSAAFDVAQVALRVILNNVLKLDPDKIKEVTRLMRYSV